MSLFDCLQTAIDARAIQANKAKVAQDLFQELNRRYQDAGMDPTAAASTAGRDTKTIMRQQLEDKRRQLAQQALAHRRIEAAIANHRNFKGELAPEDAPIQFIKNKQSATFEAAISVERATLRSLVRGLDGFIRHHSQNLLGQTRNKADLKKVGMELEGQATGDPNAAAMARALRDAFEQARQMFNAAGGHIQKLDNWRPQSWNRQIVRKRTEQEWLDDLKASVDWTKVVDPRTNLPFGAPNAPGVDDFLRAAREGILTDGWNKFEPQFGKAGKAMYNRRADARVFHFKPGEWERIATKYGSPDLFDAAIGYLQSMSRDISLMRVLGPNPNAAMDFIEQSVKKAVAGDAARESAAQASIHRARNLLALHAGTTNIPVREGFAGFMSGTRDMLTAAHLGGALISSVTDVATTGLAARMVGLSGSKVLRRAISSLTEGATREDMLRTVGVLETAMNTGAAMSRFTNDVFTPEITRRIASGVIRAQGLSHWTDTIRNAFSMEFMAEFARNAGKSWSDMNPLLRKAMERRGFKESEWDKIRSTPLFTGQSGGTFLIPDDIRANKGLDPKEAEGLAIRLRAWVEEEVDFAVPSTDLEAKAIMLQNTRPGTFMGEVARSGAMFKTFGVGLFLNHLRRVQSIPTPGGKLAYGATLIGSMTALGALAVQVKEVLRGRDPRDMTTENFWGQAFLQGGGAGIMGDFLGASTDRFGAGIATTLAGPVVGLGQSVGQLTIGNAAEAISGERTNAGRELSRFVERYTPGASLWYLRPVLEKAVFDNLQMALDDRYFESMKAQERLARERGNNRPYWEAGEILPRRAPDLSNALGG